MCVCVCVCVWWWGLFKDPFQGQSQHQSLAVCDVAVCLSQRIRGKKGLRLVERGQLLRAKTDQGEDPNGSEPGPAKFTPEPKTRARVQMSCPHTPLSHYHRIELLICLLTGFGCCLHIALNREKEKEIHSDSLCQIAFVPPQNESYFFYGGSNHFLYSLQKIKCIFLNTPYYWAPLRQ